MKAMRLTGLLEMEMHEVTDPEIVNDTDVLIKMKNVGVCGSDVHYYQSGRIGSQVVKYPFTVGHEGSGEVVAVGAAVRMVKPGDRIAIEPANYCGECDQCKAGRPHTCRNLTFLGCPGQAEGCLSEYIVMPEICCLLLPDNVTYEEGALAEPLTIGVYAVKSSIPMQNAKVGILGSGPIGLSVLFAARAQGATDIYVTDKIDERLAVAEKAGAIWTGNPDSEDIVSTILSNQSEGLDVVFEGCGEQSAMDQAINLLKPGGKLLIIGIPAEQERVSFEINKLRRKEICIQNVRRQNGCAEQTIEMIAERKVDVNVMTTHRFTFDQTQEAFELVRKYEDGVVKAMIEFE